MREIEEYRQLLIPLLPPNAFLRVDRNAALFVTDAPRRQEGFCLKVGCFVCTVRADLMYITPVYEDAPQGAQELITAYLKMPAAQRDVTARQQLALALRNHLPEEAGFWAERLKELEEDYDT